MRNLVRFNNWPLATKLVAAMALLSIVSLAASIFVASQSAERQLEAKVSDELVALSEREGKRIGESLADQVILLRVGKAADEFIVDTARSSNESYTGSDADIVANILALDAEWQAAPAQGIPLIEQTLNNEVSEELVSFIQLAPEHSELFVTDGLGAVIGASGRTSDYYQADEEWWQAGWNNGEGAVYFSSPVFDESAGVLAIEITMPVTDTQTGEVVGVLKDVYAVQAVLDEVASFDFGATGHAHVIDAAGTYVAGPAAEIGQPAPQAFAQSGQIFTGSGNDLSAIDEIGNEVVLGFAPVSSQGEVSAIDELGWVVVIEQERTEAFAAISRLRTVATATGIVMALGSAGLAFMLSRLLTRQVDEIDKVFRAAAIGEFETRAEVLSGDELGRTAEGVNAMLGQLSSLIQVGAIHLSAVVDQSASTIISTDLDGVIQTFNVTAERMLGYSADELVGKETPGIVHDLDEVVGRAQVLSNELGEHIEPGFEVFVARVRREIVAVDTHEWTYVSKGGNRFPVMLSITALRDDSGQITGFMGMGTDITDRKMVERDVSQMVQLMVDQASSSADVAERAALTAQEGDQAVRQTIGAMERIRDNTQETARRMKRLGEASQEISEVLRLLEELSDRTTVLALNASIQAAAAGEAGRGFAVVAEEVQRLAERATGETRRIEGLVQSIQAETNEAVVGVEEATREVVDGSQLAQQAGERVTELSTLVDELAGLIQHVAETTAQQTTESLAALAGGVPSSEPLAGDGRGPNGGLSS
jgi:twitching motility protein PilJ